ncbi:MAG: hypothetical protein RBT16_05680 [Desulfococcus multivorans]|nr:hypothetical protein [Desulfococcus multivorans]
MTRALTAQGRVRPSIETMLPAVSITAQIPSDAGDVAAGILTGRRVCRPDLSRDAVNRLLQSGLRDSGFAFAQNGLSTAIR